MSSVSNMHRGFYQNNCLIQKIIRMINNYIFKCFCIIQLGLLMFLVLMLELYSAILG